MLNIKLKQGITKVITYKNQAAVELKKFILFLKSLKRYYKRFRLNNSKEFIGDFTNQTNLYSTII